MGTQYYVNSSTGSDSNDGLTPATAWSTLTHVNDGTNYAKSAAIFSFAGGTSYTGKLLPPNDGLTYNVYASLSNFTGTASLSGNTLSVLSGTGGPIGIGSKITLNGAPQDEKGNQLPLYIVALGTGTGGLGNYTVNAPSDALVGVSSVTITGAPPQIVGSGSDYAFYVNARNNLTVTGLCFLNAAYNACSIQTSFQPIAACSITNCTFGVTASSATAGPLQFILSGQNMSGVTLSGCCLFGTAYTLSSTKQGIYFYHASEKFSNFTIYQNAFYNIGGTGIQMVGSSMATVTTAGSSPAGFDINGNYFLNIAGAGAIATNSGLVNSATVQSYVRNNTCVNIGTPTTPHTNVFQLQWCISVIIERNYTKNVYTSIPDGDAIEVDWAWTDASHKSNNCIVRYNKGTGIKAGGVTSSVQVVQATNTQVYGNIADDCSVGFSNTHSGSSGNVFWNNTANNCVSGGNLDDGGTGDPSGATIWYNNVFVNCSGQGFRVTNGSTNPTETYNVFWNCAVNINSTGTGGTGSVPINATSVVAYPALLPSLSPAENSPVIGFGKWTSNAALTQEDYAGRLTTNPRPDAGALFYKPQ